MLEIREAFTAVCGDLFQAYVLVTIGIVFMLIVVNKLCHSQEF